jgi:hypothetical protein
MLHRGIRQQDATKFPIHLGSLVRGGQGSSRVATNMHTVKPRKR